MSARQQRGQLARRLAILSAASVVSFLFADAVLRLVGPFPRAGKTADHHLWRPDDSIGFAPAANLDKDFFTNEWYTRVQTDEFGFRTVASAPRIDPRAPLTALFLGDSQTMGVQVAAEATWVALVGESLVRHAGVRAVNGGCNGFNTVQTFLFFQQLFERGFRPKLVVLYATNNDIVEDVADLPYARFRIGDDGFVTGLPPDARKLQNLKSAKAAVERPVNFWLSHSAVLRHAWYTYRIMRSSEAVGGWVADLYVRDDLDPQAERRWSAVRAAVRSLHRLVGSYGGKLVVAVHPDPIEWSDDYLARITGAVPELAGRIDRLRPQHGFRRIATEEGAAFVDMLDGLPQVSVRQFRFALDPHANASGHRLIALQMEKGLDRLGLLRTAALPSQ